MFNFFGELLSLYLTLALFCSFVHGCVTHLVFWMESRLAYWQDPSQSLPPTLLLLRNMLIELGCNFTRFLLLPIAAFRANPHPVVADAKLTPILLIHGYAQNQTDWFWFQYQLKQAGIGPVYTINLWNIVSSIENHADTLAKAIQHIQEKHPQEPLTLIGHSMGGLIASYYVEFLKKPTVNIKQIITIGSPFFGTRTASLGVGLSVAQMAPNSGFLEALRLKIADSNIPYYHIASKMDNMIVPWDSALLNANPNAENQYVVPDQGHVRLVLSGAVLEKIKSWLMQ